MPLSAQQAVEIEQLLKKQIRLMLADYSPEFINMPFHTRLLGKDRMALFSFIKSINTTLETSVFNQIAALIAKPHFRQAIDHYKNFNNTISSNSRIIIQQILVDLKGGKYWSDKRKEIDMILSVAQKGELKTIKRPRIDLFLEANDGTEYYFDLKATKPSNENIVGFKRKMLEWVAIRGATNPNPKISTSLAITYNPYEPKPYARWAFQGMFDLPNEMKVADEFWNFLGGPQTYEDVLAVIEKVGIELRPELDKKFATFAPKSNLGVRL